jgi:hypothetical protein
MTKEEELRTIYDQKRETTTFVEEMLLRALKEREAAFYAWRKAVQESKAK